MPLRRVRTVWGGVAGTPYYSNFYFASSTTETPAARLAVRTFMEANKALVADNLTYVIENDVPTIDEATGDILTVTSDPITYLGQGISSATMLPLSNQMLARLRTGAFAGGREIRGRLFLPGQVTTSALDSKVALAAANATTTNLNAMVNNPDVEWVVWAKSKGVFAVINSVNVWDEFAVLRSRRD